MTTIVTGAAGFIGFHVCQALLKRGEDVIGVDCLNDYYDVRLKQARLELLRAAANFRFELADVAPPPPRKRRLQPGRAAPSNGPGRRPASSTSRRRPASGIRWLTPMSM